MNQPADDAGIVEGLRAGDAGARGNALPYDSFALTLRDDGDGLALVR
jgi:hypothetical protein